MSSIFSKSRSPGAHVAAVEEPLEPRERVARVAPADRVEEPVDVLGGLVLDVRLDVRGAHAPALAGPLEELLELRREGRRVRVGPRRGGARSPPARATTSRSFASARRAAAAPAPARRRPTSRARGRAPRSPGARSTPAGGATAVRSATVPSLPRARAAAAGRPSGRPALRSSPPAAPSGSPPGVGASSFLRTFLAAASAVLLPERPPAGGRAPRAAPAPA